MKSLSGLSYPMAHVTQLAYNTLISTWPDLSLAWESSHSSIRWTFLGGKIIFRIGPGGPDTRGEEGTLREGSSVLGASPSVPDPALICLVHHRVCKNAAHWGCCRPKKRARWQNGGIWRNSLRVLPAPVPPFMMFPLLSLSPGPSGSALPFSSNLP